MAARRREQSQGKRKKEKGKRRAVGLSYFCLFPFFFFLLTTHQSMPMSNVTCPHCQQIVPAPNDAAQARCVHCGQVIPIVETHITASAPASSAAVQPADQAEWSPPHSEHSQVPLPERYATWEEFRSLSPTIQSELIKLATCALPDMRGAKLRTLPADLPAAVDDFGRPLASLTIPGEKRSLNWAVGSLFAGLGCLFVALGAIGLSGVSAYSLMILFGLAGIAFGVWYAYLRRPPLEITVWIFENGLFLQRGNDVEACAWEEVKDFKGDPNSGHPTFWITTRADWRLILSSEQTPAIMPLAEYIQVKIVSAQLLAKLRQIFEGNRVPFGILSLDRAGITGRFTSRWSEIVRVMSDDAHVFIDCRNLNSWHQVRYRDVSFPHLLLAISHVMIDEEKRLTPVGA
jgi:hypothetical protein